MWSKINFLIKRNCLHYNAIYVLKIGHFGNNDNQHFNVKIEKNTTFF